MGVRYIGTKTKIADEILNEVSRIVKKGGAVADIMCGTATVSLALRERGFRVIANDVMTYSYHHACVALKLSAPPPFNGVSDYLKDMQPVGQTALFSNATYEKLLDALNSTPPIKGYFWQEYCSDGCPESGTEPRNYFSPENAMKIDGIRLQLRTLFTEGKIDELELSLLLHDLIMAANDIANIAGTYGHYLSKLVGRATTPMKLTPSQFSNAHSDLRHEVYQGYAEEVAKEISCDLCYIDPPYMKRQYAANYHILETLARGDEPKAVGVSGLRPWRDQYSNFCSKVRIRDAFTQIISNIDCENILISYSEDGLLGLQDFQDFLGSFGKVEVIHFQHKRFKSNNSQLASTLTEYLFKLKKH